MTRNRSFSSEFYANATGGVFCFVKIGCKRLQNSQKVKGFHNIFKSESSEKNSKSHLGQLYSTFYKQE